jgi:hypothetical protein
VLRFLVAALFSLDAFPADFIVQSLLARWLTVNNLTTMLTPSNVLSA